MFTGIVEGRGTVVGVADREGARTLRIDLGPLAAGVKLGASIAVSGVCLTVTALEGAVGSFDAITETLDLTTLGALAEGSTVNLERPMATGSRFDGHIVQGHVDGTGRIARRDDQPGQTVFTIETDRAMTEGMVMKGSITVDGISLTISALDAKGFSFCAIPHTLEVTTLGAAREGDRVNLELDVVGKWVARMLEPWIDAIRRRERGPTASPEGSEPSSS